MPTTQRNFIAGIMNKGLDERLIPNGQYVDALNVRLGSTEETEIGSVENAKGNVSLTAIEYLGNPLSSEAKCIGALEDGANETIYWFVHDSSFTSSPTGKLDLIVSLNVETNIFTYHVISVNDGGGANTTLNFNDDYLITGVNFVDETLLFFTDNYNPPRFINISRNYDNPSTTNTVALTDNNGLPELLQEAILVIKKPPSNSPQVTPQATSAQNNFMEDRFCCFAYRYKYADNEYSATSQFSNPSFIPRSFNYSAATGLNDGMQNLSNQCLIRYNSGGPLVVGIDLLWKDMDTGIIKVIEKLNKNDLGLISNTEYDYTFSNSKIFTVLPSSEILRLYDNVPLFSQAQTLMGNRLVYGNYIEQRDLTTAGGFPTQLVYTTELVSEIIGLAELEDENLAGTYQINGTVTISESVLSIDFGDVGTPLSNIQFVKGSSFSIQLNFDHSQFTGQQPFPAETTLNSEISFDFILQQDYANLTDLVFSQQFQDRVGTVTTIEPMATSCDGSTFTDEFNCVIPQTLDNLSKFDSGITSGGQPLLISHVAGTQILNIQVLAVEFVDDPTGAAITQTVYEYYKISAGDAVFQQIGNPTSLHSNRSYEVGIVYMDDFNRATTVQVSENNTVDVPCSESDSQNKIKVTIPTQQLAPEWATRYKFCIKSDKEGGFNVYSNFFFRDQQSGADYFLLEGENSQKVDEGDRLRVKTDTNGSLRRCAYATVLEKKSQPRDFIEPAPTDVGGVEIPLVSGVYAKMRANEFSIDQIENPVIAPGSISSKGSGCRIVNYPVTIDDPNNPGTCIDYSIPAGSRINIFVDNYRQGNTNKPFGGVDRKAFVVDESFVASQEYDTFYEWFVGDNISSAMIANGDDGGTGVQFIFVSGANGGNNLPGCSSGTVSAGFRDVNGCTVFTFKSSKGYSGDRKNARIKVKIDVIRAANLISFETQPQDSLPDVWYESSVSYPIIQGTNKCEFSISVDTAEPQPIQFDYTDLNNTPASIIAQSGETITGILGVCGSMATSPATPPVDTSNITIDSIALNAGAHGGNVQTQTASSPAIIDTDFFNCYSMGNGVESFQILDSIKGKPVELGNRVFSTNNQDYQQMFRFADLTYSGVFNDESNVNKLNEFNLGLLNFKPLEESFGPVQKLDARETDILTLQEDKISYVLAGKNLLSDSAGGGQVASVPEVLGTQIARIEEYGISHNPESYAKWGPNKFFTDAKRGAVIQLRGSSGQNEQLQVISQAGMRSWFRDLFLNSFNTQKLGGYDPYMNEFVLSANQEQLPIPIECIDCGITRTLLVTSENLNTFCVDVGNLVGDVVIDYNVLANTGSFNISAEYNSVTVSSGATTASGSIIVNKDTVAVDVVDVVVSAAGSVNLEVTVNCPATKEITIIQVCYSIDADAGKFIHNEYSWTDGAFVSPLHSSQVELASGNQNPLISQYEQLVGPQGGGFIPANSAQITIASNRIGPIDDYVFDPTIDELRFLRTNTFYANTPNDMAALLAASQNATPVVGGPNTYQADFAMPNNNTDYLYLIYDYRRPTAIELCLGTSQFDACCDCSSAQLLVRECTASQNQPSPQQYIISQTQGLDVGAFVEVNLGGAGCVFEVVQSSTEAANATVTAVRADITNCNQVCQTYTINNISASTQTLNYGDCDSVFTSISIDAGNSESICATSISTYSTLDFTVTKTDCSCNILPPSNVVDIEKCSAITPPVTSHANEGKNTLSVGDFVTVNDGTSPACVWKVTNINSTDTAVYDVQSVVTTISSCSDLCQTYQLINTSADTQTTIVYENCNGESTQEIVGIGNTFNFCANSTPFSFTGGSFTITQTDCVCGLTLFEATICQIQSANQTPVNVAETIIIQDTLSLLDVGDHVFVGNCAYQLTQVYTGDNPPVSFDSYSTSFDCNQQCNTYQINNTNTFPISFGYVDCSGTTTNINIEAGQTQDICTQVTIDPQLPDSVLVTLIGCSCNVPDNFVIRQCRADGVVNNAIVADSPAGLKTGDFITIISPVTYPNCIWEVRETTSELPTETFNTLEDNITDCGQVCQDYEIFNGSASPIVYGYTDCAGQSVNVSIAAGNTITIAATSLTTATGVTLTLVNCEPTELLVTQCRLDGVSNLVVSADPLYNIGDFVKLTIPISTGGDCVFEVTNRVVGIPVNTISGFATNQEGLPITDCNQVCQEYGVENNGNAPIIFAYKDCNGFEQSEVILVDEEKTICMIESLNSSPDITLSLQDCDCSTAPPTINYTVEECDANPLAVPNIRIASNNTGFALISGDFVNLQSDPNCVWKVLALSNGTATDIMQTKSPITSCFDVCQDYTVVNNTDGGLSFEWIPCDTPKTNTYVVPAFSSYTICAKEFVTVSLGLTITKNACFCIQ